VFVYIYAYTFICLYMYAYMLVYVCKCMQVWCVCVCVCKFGQVLFIAIFLALDKRYQVSNSISPRCVRTFYICLYSTFTHVQSGVLIRTWVFSDTQMVR